MGGQEAPGGTWPKGNDLRLPTLSAHGAVVFASTIMIGGGTSWGIFRWEPQERTVLPVALPETPAVTGLTFASRGKPEPPTINNRDEIAFSLFVKDTTGNAQAAAFFRGTDGRLLPIVLPGQALPGGGTMGRFAGSLSLNDAGMVAFRAFRQGDLATSAYLWENGALAPVALVGQAAPDGGTITEVNGVGANNKDRGLLVAAMLSTHPGRIGFYRFADGRLAPPVTPGQQVTGGVTIQSIPEHETATGICGVWMNVSRPTEAGEYAFIATLEGGGLGIFRLEPGARETGGGKVSLVLKIPANTALGEVTGFPTEKGLCLNSQGEVMVTLQIAGRPDTVVLPTPPTP